jgi:hypothetical protein
VQDVEWLQSITTLPILLKGIVTAEDGNEPAAITPVLWLRVNLG